MNEKLTLTKREKEVLNLIFNGLSNRKIAEMLFISRYTVTSHIHNIYKKFEIKNRIELFINEIRNLKEQLN